LLQQAVHGRGRHVVQRQPGVFHHRPRLRPAQPRGTAHLFPLLGQLAIGVAVIATRPVSTVGGQREGVSRVQVFPAPA